MFRALEVVSLIASLSACGHGHGVSVLARDLDSRSDEVLAQIYAGQDAATRREIDVIAERCQEILVRAAGGANVAVERERLSEPLFR